jgi:hypothetical protein
MYIWLPQNVALSLSSSASIAILSVLKADVLKRLGKVFAHMYVKTGYSRSFSFARHREDHVIRAGLRFYPL